MAAEPPAFPPSSTPQHRDVCDKNVASGPEQASQSSSTVRACPVRELWADADGFRHIVRKDGPGAGAAHYTVLRRQYGDGSLFVLVVAGTEATVSAAMHAAERMSGRVELTWRAGPEGASDWPAVDD